MSTGFKAYIECALWSSLDDDGTPLDSEHSSLDLSDRTFAQMRKDYDSFIDYCEENCQDALEHWRNAWGETQIGHDFWLTRNGHGAGFWDRDYSEPGRTYGQQLTKAAKTFGSFDLYVGDNGKIDSN